MVQNSNSASEVIDVRLFGHAVHWILLCANGDTQLNYFTCECNLQAGPSGL